MELLQMFPDDATAEAWLIKETMQNLVSAAVSG